MEVLDCHKAVIDKFDDSVILIEYKEIGSINENDLKQIEHSVNQLIGSNPYYAITLLPQNFKNFTLEAKNFITDENRTLNNRIIDCYIAGSLARRLELELFFQKYKSNRKTKIFNSLNKALTYIANQKKLEANKKGVLV